MNSKNGVKPNLRLRLGWGFDKFPVFCFAWCPTPLSNKFLGPGGGLLASLERIFASLTFTIITLNIKNICSNPVYKKNVCPLPVYRNCLSNRGVQKNQKSDFELALYCFPFLWVPIDTVQNFSSLGGLESLSQVTP